MRQYVELTSSSGEDLSGFSLLFPCIFSICSTLKLVRSCAVFSFMPTYIAHPSLVIAIELAKQIPTVKFRLFFQTKKKFPLFFIMFTILLLLLVLVAVLLRLLNNLLIPPADSTDTKKFSPSSSSVSKFEHDVFLSFRGEDTRYGFTDHLYHALKQKGINTFRDTEKLKRGNSIAPDLLKAIAESQIAVIILSANYATSTWCLDELAHIVQSQQSTGLKFFPVFYNVEASEVRKQTKKFGKAFCKHEKTFKDDMEKVKKWRDALTKVANISGWDVRGRFESEVIQEIAKRILTILDYTSSSNWNDLIGVDARIKKMESYLDLRNAPDDVRAIGIWGMEGIGKTTLAKAVFDKIQSKFDCSAFIGEVRQKSSQVNGIVDLQKLLCKFLQLDSDANIQNDAMGTLLLRKRLRHKKVLIILDDVDELNQIEALAAGESWLGPGSRVIVTTRDKQKLMAFGVAEDKSYEVEKLTDNEAMKLFCRRAFKENHAPDDYKDLSNNFVKYAGGLPLALVVLGADLCGRKVDEWSAALARLDADPTNGIFGVLRLSCDGLEEDQREI